MLLRVPAGWREELQRRDRSSPPTIAYRPASGMAFDVRVTAAWTPGAAPMQDEIRRTVLKAAEAAQSRAAEPVPFTVELVGVEAQGYYFKATDRAPARGDYRYLRQGTLVLGDARLLFTILTNDGQDTAVGAAFAMLRSARLATSSR